MRKSLFTLLLLSSVISHAQIFTHKVMLDRFDDVVFDKDTKTHIERSDTAFVIEEKGDVHKMYLILDETEYSFVQNMVQATFVTGDSYGCQDSWTAVRIEDADNFHKEWLLCIEEPDTTKKSTAIANLIGKYCYFLTRKVFISDLNHHSECFVVSKADKTERCMFSKK